MSSAILEGREKELDEARHEGQASRTSGCRMEPRRRIECHPQGSHSRHCLSSEDPY
ncbi:hypothetical protein F751_3361 [Auxenochlorella protothecoides]|uniref:Uncharacterized protein n=1 Tax=Auxenochlorella protothecoides TaxID=3075 RepID=A0A087SBR6_AUXPR|nr:hypothetical protein F751_3361 [Auxenochlorella protothecoides]KFM23170.1 hypothetical protein F751_3361 [Auxenochlorella protothecoides]